MGKMRQKILMIMLEDHSEHLSTAQQTIIIAQKSKLSADHDLIKALRDALVEA